MTTACVSKSRRRALCRTTACACNSCRRTLCRATACACNSRRRALCRTTAGRNSLHGISTATVHFGENEVLKKTSCFAPKCHSSSGTAPADALYKAVRAAGSTSAVVSTNVAVTGSTLTATPFKVGRVAGSAHTPVAYFLSPSASVSFTSWPQLNVAAMPVGVESFEKVSYLGAAGSGKRGDCGLEDRVRNGDGHSQGPRRGGAACLFSYVGSQRPELRHVRHAQDCARGSRPGALIRRLRHFRAKQDVFFKTLFSRKCGAAVEFPRMEIPPVAAAQSTRPASREETAA